jgi:DNA repair exonuclease SbcCD ATPase subunit
MDEVVDSSLDLEARAKFTELLESMTDSNVIVISHTDTSPDAYSAVIQVEKRGDFSTYSYV